MNPIVPLTDEARTPLDVTKPLVVVCVCTHKRPLQLAALLEGLAAQRFSEAYPAPRLSIIVTDNGCSAEAESVCRQYSERNRPGWHLTYQTEPRRGITFARNAGFERVPQECDFVAMIDDDEVPECDWIEQLVKTAAATGADVVQGRVEPIFEDQAAAWIKKGRFFGYPRRRRMLLVPEWAEHEELTTAATNNVLVRWSAIARLRARFDDRLALSGSEDLVFFQDLKRAGCRIVYAPKAIVHESIPADRASLRYLFWEEYRNGNNKVWIRRWRDDRGTLVRRLKISWRKCLEGVTDVFSGIRRVLLPVAGTLSVEDRVALGVSQIGYGLGLLAAVIGLRNQHYR